MAETHLTGKSHQQIEPENRQRIDVHQRDHAQIEIRGKEQRQRQNDGADDDHENERTVE